MQDQGHDLPHPYSPCNKQYVGETKNPLHITLNGHGLDVKNHQLEKPVAAYFNSVGHSMEDLIIMATEEIHRKNVTQ